MAKHDQSDMPGIGVLDGKPNVVSRDAPRWQPKVLDDNGKEVDPYKIGEPATEDAGKSGSSTPRPR